LNKLLFFAKFYKIVQALEVFKSVCRNIFLYTDFAQTYKESDNELFASGIQEQMEQRCGGEREREGSAIS